MWSFGGNKQKNTPGKLDYRKEVREDELESQSLIQGAKQGFFQKTTEIQAKVTTALDTGHNYYMSGAFLIVGFLFLFMALSFVPILLISPNKFNLFFSIGSFFLQIALAFYYGPRAYINMVFKKENLTISLLYIGSLVFTIYESIFWGYYLLSILLIVLQVCRAHINK